MPAPCLAALITACLLAAVPVAHAAARSADQPSAAAPKKKAAAPKFIPSASQESPRERERRLMRECKGRPNAGACLGYAR